MRVLKVLLLSFTCAAAAVAQTPVAAPATNAVSAMVFLKTSLDSKNAAQGKEVKAMLDKAVMLPDGVTLPKATMLYGHVVQASPHSKEKPNGAILLTFNEARPKDAPAVPLVVQITKLSPSLATENMKQASKRGKGAAEESSSQSDIAGVYLVNPKEGSGAVLSVGTDVFLDSDIRMTLTLAPAPAKTD
jgi:hypothetical protein